MNTLRKAVYWLGLWYFQHSPTERGKWRLLSLLSACLGRAEYERFSVRLLLKPVSLLDRKLILGEDLNPTLTRAIEAQVWQKGYFLDIGANFGFFSLLAASKGAKVIAFEPSPRELKQFQGNILLSGLGDIAVFSLALSDDTGELRLAIADESNPGLNTFRAGSVGEDTHSVHVMRLADVLGRGILELVKLVKIDVEGHEVHVLSGMETVMESLRGAKFVVEVTPSYLKGCGREARQIYEFFERHEFKPEHGLRDEFQWDETFCYGPK